MNNQLLYSFKIISFMNENYIDEIKDMVQRQMFIRWGQIPTDKDEKLITLTIDAVIKIMSREIDV